jgi:hypothetical protein
VRSGAPWARFPLGALAAYPLQALAAGRRDYSSPRFRSAAGVGGRQDTEGKRSWVRLVANRGSAGAGGPGRGGWAPFAATIAVKSAHPLPAAGTCGGLRAVRHRIVSALRGSTRAAGPRARARRTCHLGGEFFAARARARTTARAPWRRRLGFPSVPSPRSAASARGCALFRSYGSPLSAHPPPTLARGPLAAIVSPLCGSTRAAGPRARARRICHLGGEVFAARARARTTAAPLRGAAARFPSMPSPRGAAERECVTRRGTAAPRAASLRRRR